MSSFDQMKCEACRAGAPAASPTEKEAFLREHPEWKIVETDGIPQLKRAFAFKDFAQAIAFTQQVGALAEAENHHPALTTEWGRVTVLWWTHKIRNLHRSDLIAAAKTDALFKGA